MSTILDTTMQHSIITLDNTRQRIDAFLNTFFAGKIVDAARISPDYAQLWQTMATLSAAGGKRLRPYITLLSYAMTDESKSLDAIIPAAAAQELLHLAMLIHDDIIDRDTMRYGIKNVTGQYDDVYAAYVPDPMERRHFSNSAAIMAGDLLISEAYRLVQQCNVDSAHIAKAQSVLADAVFYVAGGELLDTESAFRPFTEVDALNIAKQKTASYSFISPLTMGAHLADASAQTIETLNQFGNSLGVAYQLQDDLLGVFGDEMLTGKSSSGDIIEGKHTHLVERFHHLATDEQKQRFAVIFKNEQADAQALSEARQLLIDSGAKQAVEATIDEFAASARAHLQQLPVNDASHEAFEALIERCIHRVK